MSCRRACAPKRLLSLGNRPGVGGGVAAAPIINYTDGATMDASAEVNGVYRLVGATTGAEIALLECATVGPVTYRLKGKIRWYQATGTEFTGVFKLARLGTAGAITWGGTPGSRTAGGWKHGGGGTIEIQGLVAQNSGMANHYMQVYAVAWDTAPATGRCLMVGWTRPGVDTSIYASGVGYTGTSPRFVACSATPRDTPTLSYAGSAVTMTATAEWAIVAGKYPNNSGNTTVYGSGQTGTAAVVPGGSNGAGLQGLVDSRPSITKVGDSDVFILETSLASIGAT